MYMSDPDGTARKIGLHRRHDFKNWLIERGRGRHRFIMITVNPIEGTPVELLMKKMEKCCKKKWIKTNMCCIEWRETDKGMRCHMRFELKEKKNPYRCKGECYNTFKSIVGNSKHVNVRYGNREDSFIEYVKGFKNGDFKPNRENDLKLRKKYKLNDIMVF